MKKYIYLLFAIMSLLCIAACGDDDEPVSSLEKQLIGEWDDGASSSEVFHLKFDSNHRGTFWVTEHGETDITIDFKWSVNDDILTLEGDDSELYDFIFEKGRFYFVDDKLYLPDADGGGDGLIMKRTK